MPKRNSQDKIQEYYTKIRKLQRRRRVVYSSSDSEENLESGTEAANITNSDEPEPRASTPPAPLSPTASLPELPAHEDEPPLNQNPMFDRELTVADRTLPPGPMMAEVDPNDNDLDPELLEALGETSEEAADFGPNIHNKVAQRWLPILKKGLQTEVKEKLMKELTIPENCKLLKAPTLNAEISAALSRIMTYRDKMAQNRQNQLGLAISAISRGMTTLLSSDDKTAAIKSFSDGCRLLTDLHFEQSKLRIALITPLLDKSIQTTLRECERDDTLLGSNLAEKIKLSKAIERQSQQIKKPLPHKSTATNISSVPVTGPRGNWTGPPRLQAQQTAGRGGRSTPQWSQHQRGPPRAHARPSAPHPPRYSRPPPPPSAPKRSSR